MREARARQICAECPVRDECASFALELGEEHGMAAAVALAGSAWYTTSC